MANDKGNVVTFQAVVTWERLAELLVAAVQGGINHWAYLDDAARDEDGNYLSIEWRERDEPHRFGTITPDDLLMGLQRLSARPFPAALEHLASALAGTNDAITADVVFQMTVFGEVLYA